MLSSTARSEDLDQAARVVALRRLGLVLFMTGRAAAAVTPLQRAEELDPADATTLSLLGQIAQAQGDMANAIQAYSRATTIAPDNGRHHLRLGQTLLEVAKIDEALDHLARATELEPARAAGWTTYSRALQRQQMSDQALAAAQRAVKIDQQDGLAWHQLAAVAEERGDNRAALDALEHAVANPPTARFAGDSTRKDWLLHYANLAIAHGETERGRDALQAAANLDPDDADLLHQLAQFHAAGERIALLQQAIYLKPSVAGWRTELANLLAARGDHRPALDHLQRAIDTEPQKGTHWLALAYAHMQTGDNAAAEATLRRAVHEIDDDVTIWSALGALLARQGRWGEALQAYLQATALDPTTENHTECGRCLQALGRWDDALEALEQAMALDQTNAEAATLLADVHLQRDPHDGWKMAIKYARIATEYAPGELAGYKVQARAALGGKWKDEMKTALEHAYAIAPDDPELHELQGWFYFHEGNNTLALEEAERAIEFDPNSASAYYLQAQILRRQQRFLEAIKALHMAVNINRNFRAAIKELTSLGLEVLINPGR